MSLLIRIPLPVQQMNTLAGYFTDGPNMMALYGLVSQLERDARFTAQGFGLVVEMYASDCYTGKLVMTGLAVVDKSKQADGGRPITGYRYADMTAALYLKTESMSTADNADLINCLARSVNTCRVQGGTIAEFVSAVPDEPFSIQVADVDSTEDVHSFIAMHEQRISAVYFSHHLPAPLEGDALLDAYAEALSNKDTLLVCNGYRQVGEFQDALGNQQRIGEPVYTLAQTIPVYQLAARTVSERRALLKQFFWSFDTAEYDNDPHHFILH